MDESLPIEIRTAIEDLLRVASRHKVAVAGFAFAVEPAFMVNFGTVTDAGDIRLFFELCSMCEEKRCHGLAISINPGLVQ